jgi:hypothetical protein
MSNDRAGRSADANNWDDDGANHTDGEPDHAGDDEPDHAGDDEPDHTGDDSGTNHAEDDEEGYSDEDDRLAVYEWVGMLTASIGFFVPLLSLPVAGYCALRIRAWKPVTAAAIASIAISTIIFWIIVVVFVIQPSGGPVQFVSIHRLLPGLPGASMVR